MNLTTDIVLDPQAVESLMLEGDLSKLTSAQRVQYYAATCDRVGLDPIARPFDYLRLNGKLTLYANKSCAEQLRCLHNVSLFDLQTNVVEDIFIATISAKTPDGRTDSDSGAVPVSGLKGERLANAMLKGVTKAKRRVTLSLVGLGMLDETEVASIEDAVRVHHEDVEEPTPKRISTTSKKSTPSADEIAAHVMQDTLFVVSKPEKHTRGEHTWYSMTFTGSDRVCTTFSETIAADATDAFNQDLPVHVNIRTKEAKDGREYYNIEHFDIAELPESIKSAMTENKGGA